MSDKYWQWDHNIIELFRYLVLSLRDQKIFLECTYKQKVQKAEENMSHLTALIENEAIFLNRLKK